MFVHHRVYWLFAMESRSSGIKLGDGLTPDVSTGGSKWTPSNESPRKNMHDTYHTNNCDDDAHKEHPPFWLQNRFTTNTNHYF